MSTPGGVLTTNTPVTPGGVLTRRVKRAFTVRLDNFEGPFDLLLGLIAKHRLDVTHIALSEVTDEFVAHLRQAQDSGEWDLSQTSEFVLVAATLLELKAARLLPRTGQEDDEDLALIEARDLLFARLLQYRAFKAVAAVFAARLNAAMLQRPRQVGLEAPFVALLPELKLNITGKDLALIAARAFTPRQAPRVAVDHLHVPQVSVQEQAVQVAEQLRQEGVCSFRSLISDAPNTLVVVARFLAILELFREGAVTFEQADALGELVVRWISDPTTTVTISDEFDADQPPVSGTPKDEHG